VIPAFVVIGLLGAYSPAWADREGLWRLDGDAVRWLGIALLAAGGALRLCSAWPYEAYRARTARLILGVY